MGIGVGFRSDAAEPVFEQGDGVLGVRVESAGGARPVAFAGRTWSTSALWTPIIALAAIHGAMSLGGAFISSAISVASAAAYRA